MGKVTSKLQVTVPKAIAIAHGIRPGDEIEWTSAGETIRIITARGAGRPKTESLDVAGRLRLLDRMLKRHPGVAAMPSDVPEGRGWTRADLYDRDRTR